MGRGRRSEEASAGLRLRVGASASGELGEAERASEDLLRSSGMESSPEVRRNMLLEILALNMLQEARLHHEKPTSLFQDDDPSLFRARSPLIAWAARDHRFREAMQVMIDIDSTLFPLDGALQEMGILSNTHELQGWDGREDYLGDRIVSEYWGRPDLQITGKSDEEMPSDMGKRGALIGEFFKRMHSDPELMARSGVFEYAPLSLQLLREHGVEIHIFTHRSERAREATQEWLEAMEIPYDHLRVEDPHGQSPERADKVAYCLERGIGVCIDDKPATIREAEEAGVETLSLSWPYTRDAITSSDADPAQCWRELHSLMLDKIEESVLRIAREKGIPIPEALLPAQTI